MSAATVERPATPRRATRATGNWPKFIKVYREHLAWLLRQSEQWAEGVTEGARRANALVARVCEDLETRPFHAQRGAVGGLNDLWQEIEDAIEAAGEDQPREWDQFLDMAADFAGRAFGLADTEAIDTQHVSYLAELAAAQAALARVLNHTPESWAEQRVNRRTVAEVEVPSEDQGSRLRLAFDANLEVEMLAKGMKQIMETERNEETGKFLGMLSRIQLLTSIVFFAARLHGSADPDQDWAEKDSLETLRLAFEGILT